MAITDTRKNPDVATRMISRILDAEPGLDARPMPFDDLVVS
jgi:hypothetical protein